MLKVFLVGLVSQFKFESVDGRTAEIDLVNGTVRRPTGNYKVRVSRV